MKWQEQPINANFFGQSSFSNPAIVQEASCIKVESALPLEILAPMGCAMQTGAGTVFNVVKPVENKTRTLVIFGVGGVGCAAIMAAKVLSDNNKPSVLRNIIAVDLKDERLDIAQKLGATHTINAREVKDVVATIKKITDGEGADAAVDCTGSIPVINDMIAAIGPGGLAVTIGAPPVGSKMSIDVFSFIVSCKRYHGSNEGNSESKTVRSFPRGIP